MKAKPLETLTDRLRRAIAESELPMLTLANASGVERTALLRFARGDQTILLTNADRLVEYFGLRLVEDLDAAPAPPAGSTGPAENEAKEPRRLIRHERRTAGAAG